MVSDESAKTSFADSSLNKVSRFSRICCPATVALAPRSLAHPASLPPAQRHTGREEGANQPTTPITTASAAGPRQHRALCSPPTAAALARSMPHPASPPQWPDAPQDQEVTLPPLSVLSPHQQRDGLGSSPPFAFALASALATRRCPRRHTGIPVASPTNNDGVSLLAVLVDDPAPPTTRPYTRRHPRGCTHIRHRPAHRSMFNIQHPPHSSTRQRTRKYSGCTGMPLRRPSNAVSTSMASAVDGRCSSPHPSTALGSAIGIDNLMHSRTMTRARARGILDLTTATDYVHPAPVRHRSSAQDGWGCVPSVLRGTHDACTSCDARVGAFSSSCCSTSRNGTCSSTHRGRASSLSIHRSPRPADPTKTSRGRCSSFRTTSTRPVP